MASQLELYNYVGVHGWEEEEQETLLTAVSLVGAVHAVDVHVAAVVRRDAVGLVPHVLPAGQLAPLALWRSWKIEKLRYCLGSTAIYELDILEVPDDVKDLVSSVTTNKTGTELQVPYGTDSLGKMD